MTALWLMACLLAKHWLADFPWQSQWMVRNKGVAGHPALFVHALVHTLCTIATLLACYRLGGVQFDPERLSVVLVAEFYTHTVIDAVKAHPLLGGRWQLPTPRFWTALGADQLAHHFTYVWMVYKLLG